MRKQYVPYPINYHGVEHHLPTIRYADDGFGNLYRITVDKQMYVFNNWYERYQYSKLPQPALPVL